MGFSYIYPMRSLFTLLICLISFPVVAQVADLKAQSQAGDAKAMLELSERYLFGRGVTQSDDSATYWVDAALDTGHPEAQYLVGIQQTSAAFDAKRFGKGVDLLKQSAGQNFGDAAMKLSEIYKTRGTGMVTDRFYDLKQAFQYGEQAAASGDGEAMFYCGESLVLGRGVNQDNSKGIAYITQAASSKGYLPACLKMGDLHLSTQVTGDIDPFGALEWYQYVLTHRRSNIDQRASAQLGIHQVDLQLRRWQNLMLNAGGILPPKTFEYNIRE